MLNLDLIQRARWNDLYLFFMDGNPPIVLRLLLLNTIFMVFVIVRRMRSKDSTRSQSSLVIQGLLILANFAVMFQSDMMQQFYWVKSLV